jgi:hypothetical protein
VQSALPVSQVGAQYEMGMCDIAGERYNPAGPAVFVSGPFTIDGMLEVIRLDADVTGSVDCYLICRPAGADATSDQIVHRFLSGESLSFRDAWGGAAFSKCDLFLKWVFRSDNAVLTRFLLQVTKGA